MSKTLVSIVIVNYNSGDLLAQCLRSIHTTQTNFDYEVIVVDNASIDNSIARAESEFGFYTFIKNSSNVGFAQANNIGIRSSLGYLILIMNPDTLVIGDALNQLVDMATHHKHVGIVSGRLLNSNGTLQHSLRRFPTIARCASEAFFLHKLFPGSNATSGEAIVDENSYDKVQDVDWVFGAIMLVRREAINDVGLLDESFFLYSEEVDWCFRMKEHGWRILYTPDAIFVHYLGKTRSKQSLYAQQLQARRQFNYKHFSKGKAFALDFVSLIYTVNRAIGYGIVSLVRPSSETKRLRALHFNSGVELLKLMSKS